MLFPPRLRKDLLAFTVSKMNLTRKLLHVDICPFLDMVQINDQFIVEENIFHDSFPSTWVKVSLTFVVLLTHIFCCILFRIAYFERNGYMAHYRTVINQLVSAMNILVSLKFNLVFYPNCQTLNSWPAVCLHCMDQASWTQKVNKQQPN